MFEEYLNEFMTMFWQKPELYTACGIAILFVLLYLLRDIGFFRFLFRWLQRLILIAALCGLGFWMFWIGREHRVFLDNKTLGDYAALAQVNVSVNGGEAAELMARERDVRSAVGPEFELRAEVFDDNGEVVNRITRTIRPGCSKDIMISLPALAGGSEKFIVPAPR